MIFCDFQVHCSGPLELSRRINLAAFPIYEAVRLNLRSRRLRAPFRKILVTLNGDTAIETPKVFMSLNICEVLVPTDLQALCKSLPAVADFVAITRRGLRAIKLSQGFEDTGLDDALEQSMQRDPPCCYRFPKLGKTSRDRVRCEVEFLAKAGHSTVRIGFFRGTVSLGTVTVKEKLGPLYIEDEFPVRRSRVRADNFELLDRRGLVLATVPLPQDST